MADNYRIKYKSGDFEVEVESTDKAFVESKLNELIKETPSTKTRAPKKTTTSKKTASTPQAARETDNDESGVDIMAIVNAINDADNHDQIDEKILKKANQMNRILLVFYFVNELYDNNTTITTGAIVKITDQLGVKIKAPNVANKVKANAKFFAADAVRKKGTASKYKINRKGLEEYERVLSS